MTFLLLSLSGFFACSDASEQDGPVRYYDFDFVAEYLSDEQGGFRYSYLGHSGPHQEDSSARWLNLIHLTCEEGEWAETDTLSVPMSNDQLDKLFALAAALFDLGGTQNVAPHPIPPPPLLNHGHVVELSFDLGYRGRPYATRFDPFGPEGAPERAIDEYLRSLIAPDE